MTKSVFVLLLLSVNAFASYLPGEQVKPFGQVIRNRQTGAMIGLVCNEGQMIISDNEEKTPAEEAQVDSQAQDLKALMTTCASNDFGFYLLSKDAAGYKVVYEIDSGFDLEDIMQIAAETRGYVYEKLGKKYEKEARKTAKKLFGKVRGNWDARKLLGKVWRWPVAVLGFGYGAVADIAYNGVKFGKAKSLSALAGLKGKRAQKMMTRIGLVEFNAEEVKVSNKVFETLLNAF